MKRMSLSLLTIAISCGMSATLKSEEKKVVTSAVKNSTATPIAKNNNATSSEGKHLYFNQFEATKAGSSKEKQDEIAAFQQKITAELEERRDKGAKRLEEFNAKKDILSKDAREKEQTELVNLSRDLQNEVQKAQELVRAKVNQLSEDLMREIETAAIEVAKNMDADTLTEMNTGRLVYQKDKSKDITVKVTDKMNKDYEVKVAQNKKDASKEATKTASTTPAAKQTTVATTDTKVPQKTVAKAA